MRAGCFAEKRVIDLLNRRFVPYFFNRGGPGKGHDEAARKFTVGKTKNPYAYFAAFTPKGKYLGETHVYADKDAVFAWLQKLLKKYPHYAGTPSWEKAMLETANEEPTPDLLYSAGELHETLGRYDEATKSYRRLVADRNASKQLRAWAFTALMRIARYQKQWEKHAEVEGKARKSGLKELADDIEVEKGRRLCAVKKYAKAREVLENAARRHRSSPRIGEAHFYAGVACWFEDEREWAKFHWCFVVDKLPEDGMYMRAYVAAAAEIMPYPNPELDNFKARGMIGTGHIVSEVRRSMSIYRRLRLKWARPGTKQE